MGSGLKEGTPVASRGEDWTTLGRKLSGGHAEASNW
jgi:hypothetical protein